MTEQHSNDTTIELSFPKNGLIGPGYLDFMADRWLYQPSLAVHALTLTAPTMPAWALALILQGERGTRTEQPDGSVLVKFTKPTDKEWRLRMTQAEEAEARQRKLDYDNYPEEEDTDA